MVILDLIEISEACEKPYDKTDKSVLLSVVVGKGKIVRLYCRSAGVCNERSRMREMMRNKLLILVALLAGCIERYGVEAQEFAIVLLARCPLQRGMLLGMKQRTHTVGFEKRRLRGRINTV